MSILVNGIQKLQGQLQFKAIRIILSKLLLALVDNLITNALMHKRTHIAIGPQLKIYSTNWAALLALMESRPSHVNKLTRQNKAAYQGFVDASK